MAARYTDGVWLAALFLAFILSLFSARVQTVARRWVDGPVRLSLAAAALALMFCAAAAWYGVLGWRLAAGILGYVSIPVLCVVARMRRNGAATLADVLAMLALWLPLEFGVGGSLIARPFQGRLHAVAYGVAVTLALLLFLLYRRLPGMKFNLPRKASDLGYAAVGFLCAAVLLIPLGLAIGYLGPAHPPRLGPASLAARVAFIFAATALPEEILFRSLLQNWLTARLGGTNGTIGLAALIFGLSHLNNAPGPWPNWRYAIVAAVAGFLFGKVFQRSTSVVASALVHTGVNTVKYAFF